jgi:hypothetical protein
MAEFGSCNWCGKIYRLKRGLFTGMVQNRKYCSKMCKTEAEGEVSFSYLQFPYRVFSVFGVLTDSGRQKRYDKKSRAKEIELGKRR